MNKLNELKKQLSNQQIDFLLIPMRDEFGCEYVPPQGRRIEFLTNFTGSNAFVVVGLKESAFFTDGRYTLQASMEVNSEDYSIFEMAEKDHIKWLKENVKKSQVIGYNPAVFSVYEIEKIIELCKENQVILKALKEDLVDDIWQNKPATSNSKAFVIADADDTKLKTENMAHSLKADYLFETDPENIAWLLNLRGKDLAYTPIILCYLLLSKSGDYTIFTNNNSVTELGFKTKAISEIDSELKQLNGQSVQIDSKNCPEKYHKTLLESEANVKLESSPIILAKAIKNKTEIANIKQAHIADGVALCRFFFWLEKELSNNQLHTEFKLSEQLSEFRKEHKSFYSLSFDVIAGFKDNGAIIHYCPNEKTSKIVEGEGMLLVDSGAQYYSDGIVGTTDVTRTIYLGTPTLEQKRNNTLVLKGHIAVASAKFKEGTNGSELDIKARQFLKEENLDYKHGTGHGVGYFLNVHEGPHGISSINKVPLEAGMIISNEPGYYKEGEYGIRIESLVYVKKSQEEGFLELETITKAPIDLNLIDYAILTKQEKDWLNNYHREVFEQLSEFLNNDELTWLKEQTRKF